MFDRGGSDLPDQENDPVVAEDESVFETTSDATHTRAERYKQRFHGWVLAPIRVLLEDNRGTFGLVVLLLYILIATIGVAVFPQPDPNSGEKFLQPFANMQFPLGTDALGQGVLRLSVHATPPMLQMMFSGALFIVLVGAVVGTFAGYAGGRIDRSLMSITDISLAIPGLPLIVVISAIFQPRDPYVVGIILGINLWAGLARSIRSQVLTIRQEHYIEASQAMSVSTFHIVFKDILPNIMPYIAVNFVNGARNIIFNSVALYFLGILPFSNLNWGVIMNLAYENGALQSQLVQHALIVPMVFIMLISLGLILLAQSLDQIFNPRVRAKHVNDSDVEEGGVT